MTVTRTQAIKNFLAVSGAPQDLVELYNENMECQVYVAKKNNQALKDREFRGKKYLCYQCSETGTIYKPFRIPWDSMTENANYDDPPMKFDLAKYAEGVGLTGWDWKNKNSVWVGYDFDSIVNHQKGLEKDDLTSIFKAIYELPYATIRTSTTGSGYHIYVFVEGANSVSHTEHQSLARAVLNKMSLDTGLDLQAKVDQLGQILWVWASKMTPEGLKLIKKGETLVDIPLNWREYLGVVNKKITKLRPDLIDEDELDNFNELAKKRLMTPLDDKHRRVIEELGKVDGYDTYWNSDYGMLITHTAALKEVHRKLSLRGPFETATSGSSTKNCFAFPMDDGAWSVRRHGRGVTEAITWTRDSGEWTQCYYNIVPDFQTACKMHGGAEDVDGSYSFPTASAALKAAREMEIQLELDSIYHGRRACLKVHKKTDRLIIEIQSTSEDPSMNGWIKKPKVHIHVTDKVVRGIDKVETETSEEEIRHCVTVDGADAGFFVKGVTGNWIDEPRTNVLSVISSMGFSMTEREMEIGRLTRNYWTLISEPFQPEYPGGRRWNKNAAQLRFGRKEDNNNLYYPTWMAMLNHLGRGLDDPIGADKWCQDSGIMTGGDYLKCWIASIIQYPTQPLPYLFFYGKENIGKSTFHEAIDILFTKGVIRVATTLQSQNNFNGEIEGAVLGIIEELNLSDKRNGHIINKIKDLVTSRKVSIHFKGETPYMLQNTLHFAQFANTLEAAPVFTGDTRIVVIPAYALVSEIPKEEMMQRLEEEASDFTTELMDLEIPKPTGRMRIPVITTDAKEMLASTNLTEVEQFCKQDAFKRDGACVSLDDVWKAFSSKYDIDRINPATFNKHFSVEMNAMRGKYGVSRNMHWANITLNQDEPASQPYIVVNGSLVKEKV